MKKVLKIVILAKENSLCSTHFLALLEEQEVVLCAILAKNPIKRKRLRSFLRLILNYFWLKFRHYLLKQEVIFARKPSKLKDVLIVEDINATEVKNKLSRYKPDIICISGTTKIADDILELAPLALNLHHGFLPYYRGVLSSHWVSIERNYDYYAAFVHQATSVINDGDIYGAMSFIPAAFESYSDFITRVMLGGAVLYADVIANIKNIVPVKQPKIVTRNFRHKDVAADVGILAKRNFCSANTKRYINKLSRPSNKIGLALEYALNNKTDLDEPEPGLYIVNYHGIIDSREDLSVKGPGVKVPAIYTEASIFEQHIEYYLNNFKIISSEEGLSRYEQGRLEGKKWLVITFDDGLRSVDRALEILGKPKIKPTIFFNTNPLLRARPLKNHKHYILPLFINTHRKADYSILATQYDMLVDKSWNNCEIAEEDFKDFVRNIYMSVEQVRRLFKNDLIELGSHTAEHVFLKGMEWNEQKKHIFDAHRTLENCFDTKINYLSFPYGRLEERDYRSEYLAAMAAKYYFSHIGGINQLYLPGAILRMGVQNRSVDELELFFKQQFCR